MDRRRIIPIFLIVLVNFLGANIVLPSLPLYAHRHFGSPDSLIPLLNASYYAAQFVAAPFLGRLSDRYGRLPVLMVSQIGTVLSFVLMAMAGSIDMLFVARILDGITGGNIIVAQAYITDITPPKDRTRGLGLIFAAFGLGYMVGPAIGGVLLIFGEQAPFWAGALISLGTVILTWLTLDESLTAEERLARRAHKVAMRARDIVSNNALVLILVMVFIGQMSMAMLQSTFVLFGEEVVFAHQSPASAGLGIGLLLGVMGVGQFVTQLLFIKPVVSRLGERRVVILGTLLRAFGMLAVVFFASPFWIGLLAMLPFAIGSGLMGPSMQSLVTMSVSEDISGGVLGVYNSSSSLGIIIGSTISGLLYTAHPIMPYLAGGLMFILVTIPAMLLLRQAGGAFLSRTVVPATVSH